MEYTSVEAIFNEAVAEDIECDEYPDFDEDDYYDDEEDGEDE